jgi:hypothetical protein
MSYTDEFMSPRLVGKRFENHAIPFEVLKDLATLEELVLETAKWQYFQKNQDRQRVPRGFTDNISLQLTEIRDGSAIPVIVLTMLIAGQQPLFRPDNIQYFESAREHIVNAVAAAENQQSVTEYLPDHLLGYFDKLGRSLREGEALEFDPENPERPARLNKETRRRILLASDRVQELSEDVTLRGAVSEMDQDKMSFEFQLITGQKIKAPIDHQHLDAVLKAFNGYRQGEKIMIQGIGRFNRTEKLQRLESVEHITMLEDRDVGVRLDEFRNLKDGWLDGKGIAPAKDGLAWLLEQFETMYSEELETPYLYPTPEGGVQAEWTIKSQEITLEIDLADHKGEWHQLNLASEQEIFQKLNLEEADAWAWISKQIQTCGQETAA